MCPELCTALHLFAALGAYAPAPNAGLHDQSGQLVLALGVGRRTSPYVAWEAALLGYSQRIDKPVNIQPPPFLPVAVSGRADIEVFGFGAAVKLVYPAGRLEPYVGAGLGFYRSSLIVSAEAFAFNTVFEKTDYGIGPTLLAGVEWRAGERLTMTFEWRRIELDADFGPELPGRTRVGGDLLLLGLRRYF